MIQAQLSELEQQHRHLEEEITEAMRHSSIDDLVIVGLKRQKLRVKEQIEYLRYHH
jgi:hypothetical protein